MADGSLRQVMVRRIDHARHEATNTRGARLRFGAGDTAEFSPTELLLVAIAGCTGLDVDYITSRRAEPEHFQVTASGRKVRDEGGNHLVDIKVTFDVRFPADAAGDAARSVLPSAITRSHDRLCTVSRTVQLPTAIEVVQL
jgi:putative redox protein